MTIVHQNNIQHLNNCLFHIFCSKQPLSKINGPSITCFFSTKSWPNNCVKIYTKQILQDTWILNEHFWDDIYRSEWGMNKVEMGASVLIFTLL